MLPIVFGRARAMDDELDALCARVGVSEGVRARARLVLERARARAGVGRDALDASYYAACAVYVAGVAEGGPVAVSGVLRAAGGDLRMGDFFGVVKGVVADCAAMLGTAPRVVGEMHAGFMVAAEAWRKLNDLEARGILRTSLLRCVWLLFLVSKVHLSGAGQSALATVHAFHLLCATCVRLEAGTMEAVGEGGCRRDDINAFCRVTGAVPAEVFRFYDAVDAAVPPAFLKDAEALRLDDAPAVKALERVLEDEYVALLESRGASMGADERVFVDHPHLLAGVPNPGSPSTPQRAAASPDGGHQAGPASCSGSRTGSASGSASCSGSGSASTAKNAIQVPEPVTPTRSPSRKRHAPDYHADQPEFQTPRTRADLMRDRVGAASSRPGHFAKFVRPDPSSIANGDALDALAAAASITPHSPAVVRTSGSASPRIPPTPMSTGCAAVSWLQDLADARPETAKGLSCLDCPVDQVQTTRSLAAVIDNDKLWSDLVRRARVLCDRLTALEPAMTARQQRREVFALYFATVQGILTREAKRLERHPKRFCERLVKNEAFHKSVLAFSWETVTAAYGRRDMAILPSMLSAFDLPAFELVKCIESCVRRAPDLPRSLVKHIVSCEHRLLETLAWQPDSSLVRALSARSRIAAMHASQSPRTDESARRNVIGSPSATSTTPRPLLSPANAKSGLQQTPPAADSPRNTQISAPGGVPEFALELFYMKMITLASDRMQELLILLGMDAIAEQVWTSIKYAVWDKWHMMVGRHLDQIIMCSVYGVAKVRSFNLKFKVIIDQYRNMSHVREDSFVHLMPGIFRDVSLESHNHTAASTLPVAVETMDQGSTAQHPTCVAAEPSRETRGDIIKFYNQVFIHSMKARLLLFQTPAVGSQVVPTAVPSASLAVSTASGTTAGFGHPRSTANSGASSGQVATGVANGGSLVDGHDRIAMAVMSSPLRIRRPQQSPRRIGKVTVSPMSPRGRSMVAIRQSPGRRTTGISGTMTPGTRTLYAFGESPVRNLDRINKSLGSHAVSNGLHGNAIGSSRRPVPLSFEGRKAGQRTASIRRKYADALGGVRNSRSPGVHFAQAVADDENNKSASSPSVVTAAPTIPSIPSLEQHSQPSSPPPSEN